MSDEQDLVHDVDRAVFPVLLVFFLGFSDPFVKLFQCTLERSA